MTRRANRNPTPPYQQPMDAVIAALGTDAPHGLSLVEARTRLERDGPNELTAEEPVPGWKKFSTILGAQPKR